MPPLRFYRTVSYRDVSIRESPFVYPVQPEVPEAIDRLLSDFGPSSVALDILEIGTGTGIIACALAAAGHRVTAGDILPGAARLAELNARENGVSVNVLISDLCSAVTGTFDKVIFNVPNTVALTAWGTFLQHLGTRMLPKPGIEIIGQLLARRILNNARQKRELYERLLDGVVPRLRADGALVLLVPADETGFVTSSRIVAHARVEHLRSASGVRMLFLTLAQQRS